MLVLVRAWLASIERTVTPRPCPGFIRSWVPPVSMQPAQQVYTPHVVWEPSRGVLPYALGLFTCQRAIRHAGGPPSLWRNTSHPLRVPVLPAPSRGGLCMRPCMPAVLGHGSACTQQRSHSWRTHVGPCTRTGPRVCALRYASAASCLQRPSRQAFRFVLMRWKSACAFT